MPGVEVLEPFTPNEVSSEPFAVNRARTKTSDPPITLIPPVTMRPKLSIAMDNISSFVPKENTVYPFVPKLVSSEPLGWNLAKIDFC